MGWQDVTPSADVAQAGWIASRLHPFAQDVGSVVPAGFAAYARIFHPAWSTGLDHDPIEVSWSEVATWSGRTAHPEMQFRAIAAPSPSHRAIAPAPWSQEPRLGVLTRRQSRALIAMLTRFTATPEDCWLGLWDGYGYLHPGGTAWLVAARPPFARLQIGWRRLQRRFSPPRRPRPDVQRVRLPGRDYLLFKGPIAKAAGWEDGPNLWWPDDRAWCVASEIDFPYTYVGGPQELVNTIVSDPAIEAMPAMISDGITASSDHINT